MIALETKGAGMRFGGVVAVDSLDMLLQSGETVALIGPNGAGKTTAFNMITGVYKPTKGDIIFTRDDSSQSIAGKRPDTITALGIARTFQNIRLFSEMSVIDNVLIGMHMHVKSSIFGAILGMPKYRSEEKAMREKAMELLEKVGLASQAGAQASSLPYGEQRRLEIARALATAPSALLLDEPAAGMNPKETLDLTDFIKMIAIEFSLAVLLIEHHMQIVMDISDRIYVLDFGKMIASGTPKEIQSDERVIKAYLGEGADD
ncbi:MAG: ABC transporter ATP-binding protein [Eubacteriaceae bacterium]|nr:ABC transporter ATP-binding protein [Eubacteriaceae bacterium]